MNNFRFFLTSPSGQQTEVHPSNPNTWLLNDQDANKLMWDLADKEQFEDASVIRDEIKVSKSLTR